MAHELPALPYPSDSLEPYIDKMTMEIHHDKHHAAYVNNLNKALEGQSALQALSIEELLTGLDRVPGGPLVFALHRVVEKLDPGR